MLPAKARAPVSTRLERSNSRLCPPAHPEGLCPPQSRSAHPAPLTRIYGPIRFARRVAGFAGPRPRRSRRIRDWNSAWPGGLALCPTRCVRLGVGHRVLARFRCSGDRSAPGSREARDCPDRLSRATGWAHCDCRDRRDRRDRDDRVIRMPRAPQFGGPLPARAFTQTTLRSRRSRSPALPGGSRCRARE